MRLRGLPALLACVLVLCAPMSAAAQDQDEAQRRLERTRADLAAIAAQRRKLEGERGAAARALREADEQVGNTARELAALQRQAVDRLANGAARPRRVEPEQALQTLSSQVQRVRHWLNMTDRLRPVTFFARIRAKDGSTNAESSSTRWPSPSVQRHT